MKKRGESKVKAGNLKKNRIKKKENKAKTENWNKLFPIFVWNECIGIKNLLTTRIDRLNNTIDEKKERKKEINMPIQSRNLECHRVKPPYKNTSHSWPRSKSDNHLSRPNTRVHGWRLSKNHHHPLAYRRCVHLADARSFPSSPQLQIGDRIGWIELSMHGH